MKRKGLAIAGLVAGLSVLSSMTAFAGEWKQDERGWWWQNDDGSYPVSTWKWLDGNKDGLSESYYFNEAGYLVTNTTIDGYTVNADGAWTINGTVQNQKLLKENPIDLNRWIGTYKMDESNWIEVYYADENGIIIEHMFTTSAQSTTWGNPFSSFNLITGDNHLIAFENEEKTRASRTFTSREEVVDVIGVDTGALKETYELMEDGSIQITFSSEDTTLTEQCSGRYTKTSTIVKTVADRQANTVIEGELLGSNVDLGDAEVDMDAIQKSIDEWTYAEAKERMKVALEYYGQ
ncbi:MAG: hypothetical protein ACOX8K_05915 [Lachnospiraceae bacterium]|jgi:hypothetical protein